MAGKPIFDKSQLQKIMLNLIFRKILRNLKNDLSKVMNCNYVIWYLIFSNDSLYF